MGRVELVPLTLKSAAARVVDAVAPIVQTFDNEACKALRREEASLRAAAETARLGVAWDAKELHSPLAGLVALRRWLGPVVARVRRLRSG